MKEKMEKKIKKMIEAVTHFYKEKMAIVKNESLSMDERFKALSQLSDNQNALFFVNQEWVYTCMAYDIFSHLHYDFEKYDISSRCLESNKHASTFAAYIGEVATVQEFINALEILNKAASNEIECEFDDENQHTYNFDLDKVKKYLVDNFVIQVTFDFDSEGYQYSTSSIYC